MLYKLIIVTINIILSNGLISKTKSTVSNQSVKIPDIKKRQLMNNILLNSIYTSCGPLLFGYLDFFYPKQSTITTLAAFVT